MSERIPIAEEPPKGQPPYAHLLPLVQGLVDAGNPVTHHGPEGQLFAVNQGGYCAYLGKRLDWAWVQEHFDLPGHVGYDPDEDEIVDHRNWVSILGSQPVRGR
jgi:hypothetical protein